MSFLRTVSTRRLLAMIAGLVVAIAAGTAIAVAASGKGPVPKRESLAQAVRGALTARTVPGVSARVTFTNHLIAASNIQGTDPLLQGASGRLWLSTQGNELRIELQSDNGDAQLVVNKRSFWVYDPATKTAYEGKLPAQVTSKPEKGKADKAHTATVPSVTEIQTDLNKLMQHLNVSSAIPSDVAGQPTYTVQVSPKHDGGLLGDAQLAWDAVRGVPLRFAIYARGDSSPVLELKVTNISSGNVPGSNFLAAPPVGSKVVKVSTPATPAAHGAKRGAHKAHAAQVTGVAAVARHVKFGLVAPKMLVGLPRQSVESLDWAGKPAALVTYGQNLGGIAVIEQSSSSAHGLPGSVSGGSGGGGESPGLSLPSIKLNSSTGHELDTALGTVLTFTNGKVAYTVLGSVPPAAAEAAARAL